MTRRVKTKKDRTFQVVSETKNEDGTVNMEVRVKNRPGRKHGGPLWNQIPYPMTVQERIADQMLKTKQSTTIEAFTAPVEGEPGE